MSLTEQQTGSAVLMDWLLEIDAAHSAAVNEQGGGADGRDDRPVP